MMQASLALHTLLLLGVRDGVELLLLLLSEALNELLEFGWD